MSAVAKPSDTPRSLTVLVAVIIISGLFGFLFVTTPIYMAASLFWQVIGSGIFVVGCVVFRVFELYESWSGDTVHPNLWAASVAAIVFPIGGAIGVFV